ncbi:hypothetical protein AB1Y20_003403 [Prymnesium parvum]|uniref:Uncharacterized protein n=1 Tax=Prymnesium parvum TaxID=97485 RepID=A0AB34JEG5_PRYPA
MADLLLDDAFVQAKEAELAALQARLSALDEASPHPNLGEVRRQREARVEQFLHNFLPLPPKLPSDASAPSAADARGLPFPDHAGIVTPRSGREPALLGHSARPAAEGRSGSSISRSAASTPGRTSAQGRAAACRAGPTPSAASKRAPPYKVTPAVAALAASMHDSPYSGRAAARMMATAIVKK